MLYKKLDCPRCAAQMKLELIMIGDELLSGAWHCSNCHYTLQENFMMSRKEARLERLAFEKVFHEKRRYAKHLGDIYPEGEEDLDL